MGLKLLISVVHLQLMDMFHENTLDFEYITLPLQVEAVIHMAVFILRFVYFLSSLCAILILLILFI